MNNTYYKHKVTKQIIIVEKGFNWKVFLFGPLYLLYKGDTKLGLAVLCFNLICTYTTVKIQSNWTLLLPLIIIFWQANVWNEEYEEFLIQKDYIKYNPEEEK